MTCRPRTNPIFERDNIPRARYERQLPTVSASSASSMPARIGRVTKRGRGLIAASAGVLVAGGSRWREHGSAGSPAGWS